MFSHEIEFNTENDPNFDSFESISHNHEIDQSFNSECKLEQRTFKANQTKGNNVNND
jgi:hypothetical protein